MTSKKRKRYDIPYSEGRKRKQDGVASFLQFTPDTASPSRAEATDDGAGSGEWQTIKREKKKKHNYPTLAYSELHRLQTMVKLGDLQCLVLYTLADGPAPQWVSARHHHKVKRAVVLFVPGLEKWMFDGSRPIDEPAKVVQAPHPSKAVLPEGTNGDANVLKPQNTVSNNAHANRILNDIKPAHPDAYMPFKLSSSVPDPLKPLADLFPHVWPIKAPGDERLNQVHSPLHHMLQSPIPRSHEEKRMADLIKGPKPVVGINNWVNQRTRVTELIASAEELLANEYVLHPASWPDAKLDPEKEQERQNSERQTKEHGWVETQVTDLQEGTVPEKEIEKGSITAGRKVLALDCEMCIVAGGESALTRISLLDWNGDTVVDELVRPLLPIIDYLTPYAPFSDFVSLLTDPVTLASRPCRWCTPKRHLKTFKPFSQSSSLLNQFSSATH